MPILFFMFLTFPLVTVLLIIQFVVVLTLLGGATLCALVAKPNRLKVNSNVETRTDGLCVFS